jgi:uncharacterized protein
MKKCIALVLCGPPILLLLSECLASSQTKQEHPPIIDMHLHALKVAEFGVGAGPTPTVCASNENTVWYGWDPRKPFTIEGSGLSCAGAKLSAPKTNEDLMRQTLAMLQRYNIRAVTSGESGDLEEVSKWHAASDRIIPAASFERRGRDDHGRHLLREPAELRRLVAEGKIAVFAEVGPQYDGISPADPALDPYFALAEELEVPVGLHMGEGPPGGPNIEGYRVPSQDGKSVTPGRRAHSTSKTSHLRHALRLAFCG